MSKHMEIEKFLKDGNSLTGIQALEKFNVYRLSSVIHRMRRKGINVVSDEMINENTLAIYCEYSIPRSA